MLDYWSVFPHLIEKMKLSTQFFLVEQYTLLIPKIMYNESSGADYDYPLRYTMTEHLFLPAQN